MAGLAEGKVAVVTGGARGIGRETSLLFAEEGADVFVSDILDEQGRETVELIRDYGRQAEYVRCDTSSANDVERMVNQCVDRFGRLDCLVNNAGIEGDIAPITDGDEAAFDRLTAVNLRGVWLCMKYGIAAMRGCGNGGAVVNMSSLAGHVGYAGLAPYVMSKHGVNGLTKVAAIEYSGEGIRSNSVCPGCIQTDMIDKLATALGAQSAAEALSPLHPIGRLGTAREVAEMVVWVCSDRASNVTGALLSVDGGFIAQ
ncbi:MAG: glucose 1-dehydrogenase [Pseudomonadota bacterium]